MWTCPTKGLESPVLTPKCHKLSGEVATTNFIVLVYGLIRLGIETTSYRACRYHTSNAPPKMICRIKEQRDYPGPKTTLVRIDDQSKYPDTKTTTVQTQSINKSNV